MSSIASAHIADFTLASAWESIPKEVHEQAKLALLDTLGATLAGHGTEVGEIVSEFATEHWGDGRSTIPLSGQRTSPVGAAFANGFFANALDIDDGYRLVKGHPGAAILPAALAAAEYADVDGKELLIALIVGYEVAIHAGLAWHALHHEYHGTGSWGSLGAAAAAGRLLGLSTDQLVHALGIAEYHAPIAPIMKCVEHPAMVKDGIGWGAMTGISAALLAKNGFTGIPSLLDSKDGLEFTQELGENYQIRRLYFKEHACCRWAQPPIEAVRNLQSKHSVQLEEIYKVRIRTFEAALQLGTTPPSTTEEAQYNLAWPLAAALVDGWAGPDQVSSNRLNDERIRSLTTRVEGEHSAELEQFFPAETLCEVEVEMQDGSVYNSGVVSSKGDVTYPLSAHDLRKKFESLVSPILGKEKVARIEGLVEELEEPGRLETLLHTVLTP